MATIYEFAEQAISKIEDELKRLNVWSDEPLAPEKFENMGAFGTHTMAFTQWLQFVLVPRVKDIVAEQGQFPTQSNVAAFAYREFDGQDEFQPLCKLLQEFDDLFHC